MHPLDLGFPTPFLCFAINIFKKSSQNMFIQTILNRLHSFLSLKVTTQNLRTWLLCNLLYFWTPPIQLNVCFSFPMFCRNKCSSTYLINLLHCITLHALGNKDTKPICEAGFIVKYLKKITLTNSSKIFIENHNLLFTVSIVKCFHTVTPMAAINKHCNSYSVILAKY